MMYLARISGAVVAAVTLLGACKDKNAPQAIDAASTAAASSAHSGPTPSALAAARKARHVFNGELAKFTAWTDPPGVDALLGGARIPTGTDDPRSCYFKTPQQSCIPGTDAVEWSCKSECGKGCDDCTVVCGTQMETCRDNCVAGGLASCDRGCGEKAAVCVQACLTEHDRCNTGKCAKAVADYQNDWATHFGCKGSNVFAICKKTNACAEKCDRSDGTKWDACWQKCAATHAPGCREEVLSNARDGTCAPYDPNSN